MNTAWPQAFAKHLLAWAKTLEPDFGGAPAETLQRCVQQLEAARAEGHVLLPLSAVDCARLRASGLVDEPGNADFPRGLPLVIADQCLYLHRDHEHEQALAACIARLRAAPPSLIASQPLRRLFPPPAGEVDAQALAVAQALRQRLSLISGGPGTGKTSTVLRLLACVLAAAPEARVQLAAPTGKAAQRMLEALRAGLPGLPADLAEAIAARLPDEALTLHRLLGADGQGGFRHGAGRPLALDWLIVDEASMLDLALARQLFDALPESAHVVLLGDRQQLAAVQNGAVFAELSEQPGWSEATRAALQQALALEALPPRPAALADLAIEFQRSHRFAADSGIGRLATCLRTGAADAALALLREGATDLEWLDESRLAAALAEGLAPYARALAALWAQPQDAALLAAVWQAWEGFRVLCAGHAGPLGTGAVNAAAARWLATALQAEAPGAPAELGQPLLVTRNQAELVNGDILLLLPTADGPAQTQAPTQLQACLRRGSQMQWLALARLPDELAGAFALTVHKAQGSEFERCLLLLPELAWTGREWLYTGATRARRRLLLLASETALRQCIGRAAERRSGLRRALLGDA